MSTAAVSVNGAAEAAVLEAIQGKIEPVRTSREYVAGMALVALVMILLPLVYLGLIALVAALLWYHATHNISVFAHASGRNAKGAVAMYAAPLALGGIVLLFMIKPLFAPRRRESEAVRLDPEAEPLLFAFVEKLCASVHAPAPREIRVDSDVNASASLRQGFWSLFRNDLTLTIGLPLAAGMSLRQLAGVLAHEFGHFSQGAGMRLTYIIRSINFWFLRVVYERDAWDERLIRIGSVDVRAWLFVQAARGCVWLTRRILWVLMWIGHIVSCFMLRQMEYDADRHEARLAGSDTFRETARRLVELSVARQMALGDIRQFLDEGRLPEDLPALVLANVPQITPEIRKQAIEPMSESKTGLFDTHPAERDRISSAALEKAPGIFRLPPLAAAATHPDAAQRDSSAAAAATGQPAHLDAVSDALPATVLFRDFAKLSRIATIQFYEEQLERKVQPQELCSVASLVGSQQADVQANKALEQYFHETVSPLRPLPLPAAVGIFESSATESMQALDGSRQQMQSLLEAYKADFKAFDEADSEHLMALIATAIHRANAGNRANGLKYADLSTAAAAAEKARLTMDATAPRLKDFEVAAARRLTAALTLMGQPAACIQAALDGDARARAVRLLATAHLAATLAPEAVALRNELAALSALLGCVRETEKSEPLVAAVRQSARQVRAKLVALRDNLMGKPYPFDHAQTDMTLDRYVVGCPSGAELPDPDSIGEIGSLASEAGGKLFSLYHRALSHLAVMATKVEQAVCQGTPDEAGSATEP